ncbi:hypothetical protein JQ600_18385 [Bradyrhizobium sp. AUGA SZCCT0176]|uniref:hypothetical protein n=1 Tax=Bradyrhizobium sp. AUGA SZCCT0176 TaxID=2807664 RepID=UPI001BAA3ECA|nr:hypothetical protein [Bradyrhizobium sp. AUGA SZCCT0176]MBR1226900.1 hypothetical protein [Bradyrhizobium sp. AUGA SZCCT0176]
MTKHYLRNEIQIIPPSRPVPNVTASPSSSTPVPLQHRQVPDGIVGGVVNRWVANSQARTYDSYKSRSVAQRGFVEADTALGLALIDNQRMRQQFSELPIVLAADRQMRQLKRGEEISTLMHQIEIAESQRERERVYEQARRSDARRTALDAEQQLDAQREYGPRLYVLQWEHKLNEWEMQVEEQRVVLGEHRRQSGRGEPSLDDLHAAREQMNADGVDTTPIDLAIARAVVRQQKVRK